MRALLALRAIGVDRARVGGHLRALPGRACRAGPARRSTQFVGGSMDEVLNAEASETPRAAPLARRRLEIWLPLVIVVLDQLSKAAVRAALPLHQSVTIIPGLVDFTHVRNT